jgi:hypothetical protein
VLLPALVYLTAVTSAVRFAAGPAEAARTPQPANGMHPLLGHRSVQERRLPQPVSLQPAGLSRCDTCRHLCQPKCMWLCFAAHTFIRLGLFILDAEGRGLDICAVDLLPSRLKLQIFVDMPWRIRLATIAAPFKVRCSKHCARTGASVLDDAGLWRRLRPSLRACGPDTWPLFCHRASRRSR